MDEQRESDGLTPEEAAAQRAEQLPAREAMSVVSMPSGHILPLPVEGETSIEPLPPETT